MKAEILEKIKEIADKNEVLEFVEEFNELANEFNKIQREEEHAWEVSKLERIEAGEKPENIEKPVYELVEEFKSLSKTFNHKKKAEIDKQKEIEKANLTKKQTLIAALKDLIQNEENIGRAIGRYRDIQEAWKEVGPIPRDKRQDISKEFSGLIDSFQYNINIYKEIKDHDLSRNLQLKKDLIEKLKALLSLDRIKDIEQKLHEYQDEWNGIGGTHQDEWEKIKEAYWDTVNAIYEKIRGFYSERKEQQLENLEKKKGLVAEANEINSVEYDQHKGWKKATDKILKLQEDWKSIGFGPKAENDKIWKEFRGICNDFFTKKKAFYNDKGEEFDEVKTAKEKLIAQVESLKDSTDWKNTTKKILDLQKKWKEAGSAGPKFENKLWKKFRGAIDHFFEAKEAHFNQQGKSFKENLKKKEELIQQIDAYKVGTDSKKAMADLQEFTTAFASIGHVPRANMDKINKAYKKAIDAKYAAVKMDEEEKQKLLFEAELEAISSSDNKDQMLDNQRNKIRGKINKLKQEVQQYENNLSFFANADESNPLFKNVMDNIASSKAQIDELKAQLKMIRDLEHE